MNQTTDDIVAAHDSGVDLIDEKLDDDNYKIINFFKNEPSMLITIITTVITVVTVILSFVANSIQRQYLSYWNISTDLIEYNTTNLMYQLGISIVICFSSITCITLINIFYARYFNDQMQVIQAKYAYKECKRHFKKIVRKKPVLKCCVFILEKTKFWHWFKGWSELLDKSKGLLNSIDESLENLAEKVEKTKKVCTLKKQFALPKLIVELVALSFGMFLLFFLFNMFIVSDGSYLLTTIIMTLTVITFYSFLGYLTARHKVPRKQIKKMVNKYLSDEEEWKEFEYKNEYNKKEFKEFFTDTVLKKSLVMVTVFLSCFLVYVIVAVAQNPKEQKDFYIVKHQEESYVVLHTFDNNLVLEKATKSVNPENGQTQIVIDTSGQTIISIDGVTVQHCKYDVVKQKKQEQQ